MKKIFGWLFIVAGVGNFIRVVSMFASGASQSGGQNVGNVLFFAIGFFGLGVWMIKSSIENEKNN